MNRFMVCLFPALLLWAPIVTILPMLEARPVTISPSTQAQKDGPTSSQHDHSYGADFGAVSRTICPTLVFDDVDSFVDNFTIGYSTRTPIYSRQPDAEGKFLPEAAIILSVVLAIYSIVGTIGNGLVILAFCTYTQVRSSAHSFILSIAISDILMTGLQFPTGIASMITGAPSVEALCPVLGAMLYFSTFVSFLSMALVAFNKYVRVCKSTGTYQKLFAPLKTFLWVLLVWILSGLLTAPGFLGYGKFGWGGFRRCGLEPDNPYTAHYISNIFGFFYWLILFAIGGIYLRIFFFVKDSVTKMAAANPNQANPEQHVSRRVIKQTKHMFILFCAFAVSTAPNVLLFGIHVHTHFLNPEVALVTIIIYFLNHVMNPFLYAWKLFIFRRAFKALVRCKRHLPYQPGALAVN